MNSILAPLAALLQRRLTVIAMLLALLCPAAFAQTDPPGRVAALSHMEGSVAFAAAGESEWIDAVLNRPVTRGDRLWSDRNSRAELHLGSGTVHMDGQTYLEMIALDERTMQASLQEGSLRLRLRNMDPGENVEVDTPQLAFRAMQPGDYRIDSDPARGITRVTVQNGQAVVYGESGNAMQLQAGQQVEFTGRALQTVAQGFPREDDFDRWAANRNQIEDQSVSARYLPRGVVGYPLLDASGNWSQDPAYGPVWYPRVTVADWAPYRYGHWSWIAPWGWTWIDDAPWWALHPSITAGGRASARVGPGCQAAWPPDRFIRPHWLCLPAAAAVCSGVSAWAWGRPSPGSPWRRAKPGVPPTARRRAMCKTSTATSS